MRATPVPVRGAWWCLTAAAVLVGAGLARPVHGQSRSAAPPVVVAGEVVDRDTGRPLAGALVEVAPGGRQVVTDSAGRFQLRLRPRDYVIAVSKLGYAERQQGVAVTDGGVDGLRVELTGEPVLLEGLRVVADRFEQRRKLTPYTPRVISQDRLDRGAGENLATFLRLSSGLLWTNCPRPRSREGANLCVLRRGEAAAPVVYVDDRRLFGGMDDLLGYLPVEMHHVEIYGMGMMIRVYTRDYVEAVARGERKLLPFVW